ncbi:MAG: hypothetical protein PWQ82_1241 [Thermosediminibacterales bacterium]|nr:hypothetical protein [Thermosediminibacterales bacterium]MDK2836765.1 hypothetical protein [Thermosediminibacterales bacterium]
MVGRDFAFYVEMYHNHILKQGENMKLFDAVPENLFSILSSPLKEYYSDILFKIYEQYMLTTFTMKREVIIDIIIDYIDEHREDQNFSRSLDEDIWENSMENVSDIRSRANYVLRKLESCGWVMIETYSNYEQYISLPDYAIKIMETLDKIRKNYQAEYQGYVYATYSLLYSQEAARQGHIALEKAFEQTEQLISGLKSLNHNIKRYIERVLTKKQPKDILRIHFEDYKNEILDKSYHRLKTSDNVSKYRPKIIQKINQWQNDPTRISEIATQDVRRGKHKELTDAKKDVYRKLDFIRQSYINMDSLLEEIDRRNSQYASASFMQLKYILNSSKNLEGQLVDILTYLADKIAEGKLDRKGFIPEKLSSLFSLYSQDFIDENSLYTPRTASRNHSPEAIKLSAPVSSEVRRKILQGVKQKLDRKMTRDKIDKYVLENLKGRDSIKASQLEVKDIDDFLKLIYISAYSQSKNISYKVDFTGDKVVTPNGRFEFRDIKIKKKRGNGK